MNFLKLFFTKTKKASKNELKTFIQNGATILDVRSEEEYKEGHISNSKQIALQEIKSQLEKIEQLPQPIITVCKSGVRSGMAQKILASKQIDCYNGGAWNSINELIQK